MAFVLARKTSFVMFSNFMIFLLHFIFWSFFGAVVEVYDDEVLLAQTTDGVVFLEKCNILSYVKNDPEGVFLKTF
jgi:hypothetical protein